MALIGNLFLRMATSTGELGKGVKDARGKIGTLSGTLKQLQAQNAAMAASFSKLNGGIKGLAASAASAAALGGFTKFVTGSIRDLQQLALTAERAGVSVDALKGIQHAARSTGSDVESFSGLVTGLNQKLAEASTTDNETSLALRGLGLSAGELLSMKPDVAIGKIGDALAGVEDPGRRAALTMQLFGEEGLKNQRTLLLGSEGLARYAQEAKALNGSFNGLDASSVEEANRSFALMETAIGGAKNQLVVALAPAVTAVAGAIAGMTKTGVSGFGSISGSAGLLTRGIGLAADAADMLKIAFLGIQFAWTKSIGVAVAGLAKLSDGIDQLAHKGKESGPTRFLRIYAEELDKVAADQSKKLGAAWLAQPPSNRLKEFYDDIADSAKKAGDAMKKAGDAPNALGQGLAAGGIEAKIREFEREANIRNATIGRDSDFAKLSDLKTHGATDEQLGHASFLAQQNRDKEDVMGANRDALEKSISPVEKIFGTLAKAMQLRASKMLSATDLQIAQLGAQKELLDLQEKNLGEGGTKFAGAAELGSAEAYSAILQAVTGTGGNDAAHQAVELAQRQLDIQLMMARSLDRMANATPVTIKTERA